MTTQHTPGPWEAVEGNAHHGPFVTDIGDRTICDLYTLDGADRPAVFRPEEAEANARLIAAAPDLLAALEELCLAPNKHRPEEYWEDARAAIAKAKGE